MPNQLHHYRPQRTDIEYLEAITVGRDGLLEEMLGDFRAWRRGRSQQHHLLIGPRGIGKTHVLRLLGQRLRKSAKTRDHWQLVVFAEEEFRITRVADLLLRGLDILAQDTGDRNLAETYEQLRHNPDDATVVDLALDSLRRYHSSSGRALALLLENVDRLFDHQMKRGQEVSLLRKILLEEEWLALVCTSPTYLNAVQQHDQPLFEFFRVHRIQELTARHQLDMFLRMAEQEGNTEIVEQKPRWRSRLQTLQHFTGGNPRLTTMLYDLVAHRSITDVRDQLDELLDRITPYYQDRMRDLSEQEAQVLTAMALAPENLTPTELAREIRLKDNLVRAVLVRLERAGYVRASERRKRRTLYMIPERFFRIWHQMTHDRISRGRVRYLLDFFASWYPSRKERDRVWQQLVGGIERGEDDEDRRSDYQEMMGYIAEISPEAERFHREIERACENQPNADPVDTLHSLDAEHDGSAVYLVQKGMMLAERLRQPGPALAAFERAIELDNADPFTWFCYWQLLRTLGRPSGDARDRLHRLLYGRGRGTHSSIHEASRLVDLIAETDDRAIATYASRILLRETSSHEEREELAVGVMKILAGGVDAWRRRCAATAVGELRDPSSVPSLMRSLDAGKEPAAEVRGSVATALGKIGDPRAVEPLVHAIDPGREPATNVRGSAATALGKIGDSRAVEPLVRALDPAQEPAAEVRRSAATALGRIGGSKAVEPLLHAMKSSGNWSAAAALRVISEKEPIPEVSPVVSYAIQHRDELHDVSLRVYLQPFLEAAFRSQDLDNVRATVQAARGAPQGELIFAVEASALSYLESGSDPAVLERITPETQDAVELLVGAFEQGYVSGDEDDGD